MKTNLQIFWEKLDKHDWFYFYSDDDRVYRAGLAAEKLLKKEAREGGAKYEILMADFHDYHFSGAAVSKRVKPSKPE